MRISPRKRLLSTKGTNMIRMIFCAAAALSCCGATSLFGQNHSTDVLPTLDVQQATPVVFPQDSTLPNPFDFAPSGMAETPSQPEPPASAETASDPSSLPVTRSNNDRSVVDTIVDQAALMNTPHASYEAVDWCGSIETPNPVGEVLLRQFCVEGLWDGYEAQRACVCARMWHHLQKHHCGGCGHSTGCPSCACVGRASSQNRYRQGNCGGHCGTANTGHCASVSQPTTIPAEVVVGTPNMPSPDRFAERKSSVVR
jgi:hypothetical protein